MIVTRSCFYLRDQENLWCFGISLEAAPLKSAPSPLQGSPLQSISDGDYPMGAFRHADDRRALLLNNYHFAYSAWPTVEFDAELSKVLEVSPKPAARNP